MKKLLLLSLLVCTIGAFVGCASDKVQTTTTTTTTEETTIRPTK